MKKQKFYTVKNVCFSLEYNRHSIFVHDGLIDLKSDRGGALLKSGCKDFR